MSGKTNKLLRRAARLRAGRDSAIMVKTDGSGDSMQVVDVYREYKRKDGQFSCKMKGLAHAALRRQITQSQDARDAAAQSQPIRIAMAPATAESASSSAGAGDSDNHPHEVE